MGIFCGNVIELVEKYKIFEDYEDFVEWKEIENNPDVEVFIENSIVSELEQKDHIIIDAVVGEANSGTIGMLFIKTESNMYGTGC